MRFVILGSGTGSNAETLLAEWHGRLNQTPELALIFIKGAADTSEFSEQEQARFLAAIAGLFILLEGLYRRKRSNGAVIPSEFVLT